jgi:hypothetical protein
MSSELSDLKEANKVAILARGFTDSHAAMTAVEALLGKPETDKVTDEAHIKAVDMLTDLINLINEQAQRNPPPQAGNGKEGNSAEEMAFLTGMMKEGKIGKGQPMKFPGGGNMSGGSTDRASSPTTGNAAGKGSQEKTVQKASGAQGISLPAEFREQLENYFKALEQEPE